MGRSETVTPLLNRGAEIIKKDNIDMIPLHITAQYGHLETVTLLLDRGAEIEAEEDNGRSPFHKAAS